MNRTLTIILLMTCLLATAASARDLPTVTPLNNPTIQPYGSSTSVGDMVGNLNPPAYSLSDWFYGDEAYKYVFNPLEQVGCQLGFALTGVHMVVAFEESMVPVTFNVVVDMESAVWDGSCYVPGPVECVSSSYEVTIETAGTYDLSFPIDCECAFITDPSGMPYMYALGVYFDGVFPMNIVTDGIEAPCTSFNFWDPSVGWYDLNNAFADAGNVLIYGDTVCCDEPVAEESSTWGEIKGLYR